MYTIPLVCYHQVEKLEAEVNRWRSGETVRPEEQVNLLELEAVTPVTSFIEEKPPVPVSIMRHFRSREFMGNLPY